MTDAQYTRGIRSSVRGLYNDVFTYNEFVDSMLSTIRRGFTNAWRLGAKEAGFAMDELTPTEITTLESSIIGEFGNISRFAEAIEAARAKMLEAGSKISLRSSFPSAIAGRIQLWINTWQSIKDKAFAMASKDAKGMWLLGATKVHCITCAGFNNRVYRFSTWVSNGALPRSRRLRCNGYNCDCRIEKTDALMNRGRFPARLLR